MVEWLSRMKEGAEGWLDSHSWVLWFMGGLSIGTLALSVVLIPVLIARLPADYYVRTPASLFEPYPGPAAWLHWTVAIGKNFLGLLLLVAGSAMLFLPGQGLLTILAGLALVDFPYKRRLELRLFAAPGVAKVVAWARTRAGKPPLRLP